MAAASAGRDARTERKIRESRVSRDASADADEFLLVGVVVRRTRPRGRMIEA